MFGRHAIQIRFCKQSWKKYENILVKQSPSWNGRYIRYFLGWLMCFLMDNICTKFDACITYWNIFLYTDLICRANANGETKVYNSRLRHPFLTSIYTQIVSVWKSLVKTKNNAFLPLSSQHKISYHVGYETICISIKSMHRYLKKYCIVTL